MKIAYLINHLDLHGGIEKMTTLKINAWIELYNYDVVLITKKKEAKNLIYDLNKNCKVINLEITNFEGGRYLKNVKNYFTLYKKISDILKSEKVNIVITTLTSIDSLILPFMVKKIPKILEFHHSGIYLNEVTWKYKKYFLKKYDATVVLNKDEAKYYNLPNHYIIPNFLEKTDRLKKERKQNKIIISAGRIDPIKQFDHMVEIWSLIVSENPGWQFHIYGDGSAAEKAKLNELIQKKGLSQTFKIYDASKRLQEKLEEASIFVLTSKSESFSLVILEAMNKNLPVISYDSPNGPRNIITNNVDGIIVPINNKHIFSSKLNMLMNNESERNKLISNQPFKIQEFAREKIMEKWNELISGLI